MGMKIIYENKDFIILDKPAGLLVHPVKRKDGVSEEPTLADWLLKNYPETRSVGDEPSVRPGIVHRLDKDTSGVILVARNNKAFDYFKDLFQRHEVKKNYLALAWGRLKKESGAIDMPIGIKSGTTKRSVRSSKMAKEAITEYKTLKVLEINGKEYSFLEVFPKTGRTHQIRVHLAAIGHPVIGDKLYGGGRSFLEGVGRQLLHAFSLEFTAPDGKRMRFEADLPEDFRALIK